MRLKRIEKNTYNVSASCMWDILVQYGDVSQFHGGVLESY